jgi:hypothetical protein
MGGGEGGGILLEICITRAVLQIYPSNSGKFFET